MQQCQLLQASIKCTEDMAPASDTFISAISPSGAPEEWDALQQSRVRPRQDVRYPEAVRLLTPLVEQHRRIIAEHLGLHELGEEVLHVGVLAVRREICVAWRASGERQPCSLCQVPAAAGRKGIRLLQLRLL